MLCKVTHYTGHISAIVESVHDNPGCMLVDSQLVSASLMIKVSDNVCGHTPLLQTALPSTQDTSHGASCT